MRNLFLLSALLLGLVTVACQTPEKPQQRFTSLKIFHTNDVHGHLLPNNEKRGGLAYLTALLKNIRAQEPEALILDAGDFFMKGNLPAQRAKGQVTAEALSLMKFYDVRAVGNNEIKVGLKKLVGWSEKYNLSSLVSANLVKKNGEFLFAPYNIIEKKGLKVGIIGGSFWYFDTVKQGRDRYRLLDIKTQFQKYVQELRPQVDVIILLSHTHYQLNEKFAQEIPGVDLIVSGHSHYFTGDQESQGTPLVVEAGEHGHFVGVVDLVHDRQASKVVSTKSTYWAVGPPYQMADREMEKLIKKAYKKWAPHARRQITRVRETLDHVSLGNPFEGDVNNIVADVFGNLPGVDVGIANEAMVRDGFYEGPVRIDDVYLALPYPDTLVLLEMDKKRFRKMMEDSIEYGLGRKKLLPFAFSKLKVQLKGKKPRARLLGLRGRGVVRAAAPEFIIKNCKKFFVPKYCPIPIKKKMGTTRKIVTEAIRGKILVPPPSNRVRVL